MIDKDKLQYIVRKRKKAMFYLFVIAALGSALYVAGMIHKQEKNKENAMSGGSFEIIKKVKKEIETKEECNPSENLLKSPVLLSCNVDNGQIRLKESFKIAKTTISDGVFDFQTHGDTCYSTSFHTKEGAFDCRGTMKLKSDKFFIYSCFKK
ncbi:MAG: hypothetical protein ACOX2F_05955 [bacterium]